MVRFGTVKCFFSQEEKRYGFIEVEGDDAADVHFHADNYCDCSNRATWLDREPRIGDRVAFKMDEARTRRPKASLWTYESEYRPRLKIGEPLRLRLDHLPVIGREELQLDDVCVGSLDVEGSWGRGPRETWIDIVLRTRTGELFQFPCWEGELGGDSSDLPLMRSPEGLSIKLPKRKKVVIDPAKAA